MKKYSVGDEVTVESFTGSVTKYSFDYDQVNIAVPGRAGLIWIPAELVRKTTPTWLPGDVVRHSNPEGVHGYVAVRSSWHWWTVVDHPTAGTRRFPDDRVNEDWQDGLIDILHKEEEQTHD